MEKEQIIKLLTNRKVSVTKNRIDIIHCLTDGKHFHSINEITKHNKSFNTKSVYNNIKILIADGIVDSYSFSGTTKYAMNDNLIGLSNSAHIVNKSDDVSHIELSKKIFDEIKKEVASTGKDIQKIKIFIHTED